MPREEDTLKKELEEILGHAQHPEASRALLSLLFPKVARISGAALPRSVDDTDRQGLTHRISNREFAQTYFGLAPDALSWGRKELEEILDLQPAEAMQRVERRLSVAAEKDRSRLRRQFLDALPGAFGAERPFTGEWLRALVDYSAAFLRAADRMPSLLYFVDNEQRIRRAILLSLDPQTSSDRAIAFAHAVTRGAEFSILCSFFRTVVGDKNLIGAKNRDAEYFGPRTEEIRHLLLVRVKDAAMDNSLWAQVSPGDALWFWWGCGTGDDVRAFTEQAINNEVAFRSLLRVPIHRVYSTSGDYDTINPEWSKVVDLELLEARARQLPTDSLDRELAEEFLAALERGRSDPVFTPNN